MNDWRNRPGQPKAHKITADADVYARAAADFSRDNPGLAARLCSECAWPDECRAADNCQRQRKET